MLTEELEELETMATPKIWQPLSSKDGLEEEFKIMQTNKKMLEIRLMFSRTKWQLEVICLEDKIRKRRQTIFIIIPLINQISN